MTFVIEDFEDLSGLTIEKLRKLDDVAGDYEQQCYEEWLSAQERRQEIQNEIRIREEQLRKQEARVGKP